MAKAQPMISSTMIKDSLALPQLCDLITVTFIIIVECMISVITTRYQVLKFYTLVYILIQKNIAQLINTISVTSPINLFIIVIYCPPGPLGDFLEEMDTLLSNFPSDGTPLTVLGDFNLPSDKLQSSCLLPFLNTFSLTFNSCPPTHKGGNVLDLVFTRPTPATDMTATLLPISDHHLVSFLITLPIQPKNNLHVSLIRPNRHSISPSSVTSCTLSSLPDPVSFSSLPLDVATDSFLSSLSSTMDLLCPLTTKPKKTSCPTPWLSEVLRSNRRELRSAERKWKKSQLDVDLSSYRALLTRFSLEVTSAKTTFYKEKLEASAQDPRKLHNIFSSLLNPPAAPAPSSLTANDFASFYDEKIRKICQTFTSSPTMTTQHSQQSTTSLSSFSTLTEDEILQVIRSCNPTTCPLDTIPSNTLQTIAQDLLPFISTIINGSLTSDAFGKWEKVVESQPLLQPSTSQGFMAEWPDGSLSSVHMKVCMEFAKKHLKDSKMVRNKILWSDETKIEIICPNSNVWKKPGTAHHLFNHASHFEKPVGIEPPATTVMQELAKGVYTATQELLEI
ncbi:hypothetical protein C0J50_17281 [Silurus asotus]|uniref:Endonuclease/exonuclease/phosphatase domain-containing protein n=1 Tax=Silurus asotus TaxID=30991 RepID=A0AAD5AV98_SILAS|nr:hypothetical protein C0J50_17281 [Silurus asotus]